MRTPTLCAWCLWVGLKFGVSVVCKCCCPEQSSTLSAICIFNSIADFDDCRNSTKLLCFLNFYEPPVRLPIQVTEGVIQFSNKFVFLIPSFQGFLKDLYCVRSCYIQANRGIQRKGGNEVLIVSSPLLL